MLRYNLLLCLSALVGAVLQAAPDTVSTVFNDNAKDVYRNDVDDFGSVASFLFLPDGSLLVGSNEMATTLNGSGDPLAPLLKFNPDGTVAEDYFADTTADGEGLGIIFDGQGFPEVQSIGRQSDGKIIAAGVMTGMDDGTTEVTSRSIVRINTDGTVDDSFQTEGTIQSGFLNYINHVIVDPDDKIVVSGGFRGIRDRGAPTWTRRAGIARLNADGSLDSTFAIDPTEFGVPASFADFINAVFYQVERDAAGRYYVVGEFSGSGVPIQVFARLFPDGSRDFSFAPNLPEARWNSVALDREGRVTVTGLVDFNPTVAFRLFADGSLDPSFNLAAGLGGFQAQPLEIDTEGRFIYRSGASLGRILESGAVDPSFTPTAAWVNWSITPSFNLGTTAPDGSIYAGGFFDQVEGQPVVKLVRFEGDPVVDALLLDHVNVTASESAGTIYLGVTRVGPSAGAVTVDFASAAGTALAGVDFSAVSGTLSWAPGESGRKTIAITLLDNAVLDGEKTFSLALSNPSGISVAGASTSSITVLDDESGPTITVQPLPISVGEGLNASFFVGVGSAAPVTFQWFKDGVAVPGATTNTLSISSADAADDADYSVEVTAAGVTVSSASARLTVIPAAAEVDTGFSFSGTAPNSDFEILTDGSILMRGYTSSAVQKLDSDFQLDPSFTVPTVSSGPIPTPIPLPNGQWLATGSFTSINGESLNSLARMNADGTVDTSFVPFFNGPFEIDGSPATFSTLRGVSVAADGTVYVMVNRRLFRMLDDGSIDTSFNDPANYGSNGSLLSVIELDDGSVIVNTGSNTSSLRGIRRLRADGSLQTTITGTTLNDLVSLGGRTFAGFQGRTIEIFDADTGLVDSITFDSASNFGNLRGLRVFRGQLLVNGATSYQGQAINELALLSLDGVRDPNFPGKSGINQFNVIDQIEIDPEGRILVRSRFGTTWNGIAFNDILRLLVDRAEVGFAVLDSTAAEADESATVELVRYGDLSAPASVRVQSTSGTALSGLDFAVVDQVINWAANDGSPKSIQIALSDDTLIEGDESFTLVLSDVSGATLIPNEHRLIIFDDDSIPQITSQPTNVDVLDGGSATFSVAATNPISGSLTYQWLLDGQKLSGETTTSLTIDPASSGDEGNYSVVLTNDYGSATSIGARLSIIEDPTEVIDGFVGLTLNGSVFSIAAAPDGGAYVGGQFTDVDGDTSRDYLIKVNADGTLDTNFTPPTLSDPVYAVALQADGKLLAGGDFRDLGTGNARGLARFHPTGALDAPFMAAIGGGAVNSAVRSLAVLKDGDIIVGGGTNLSNWNGNTSSSRNLLRLSGSGAFEGFYANTRFDTVQEILPLPDGRVLAAFATTSSGQLVRRYNSDFSFDNTFAYAKGSTSIYAMALAQDGAYIFGEDDGVFKVSATGAPVATLRDRSNGFFRDVAVQLNGKVVIGSNFAPRLQRFLTNDVEDPVFAGDQSDFNNAIRALALTQSGTIWVGGDFTGALGTRLIAVKGDPIPLAITQNPDSVALDPGATLSLTGDAISTSAISYQWFKDGLALADDARISGATTNALTISGVIESDEGNYTFTATSSVGTEVSEAAFVNVLGAPEILSLSGDVAMLEGNPLVLEVEAVGAGTLSYQWFRDNSLLAGQTSATLNITPASTGDAGSYTIEITNSLGTAVSDPILVEIAANQAAIASGWTSPTVNGVVYAVLPLADGRALVGGSFGSITDGVNSSGTDLAVVNVDGTVDPVPGLSATGIVRSITAQSDGKILLGGSFTEVNGVARLKAARLNVDLTLDPSFAPVGDFSFGEVRDIREEASGSILAVGNFFDYNGIAGTSYAVRLTDTGAHDPSFAPSANSFVNFVRPQADGSLILGGWFSDLGGNPSADYLTRIGSDGTTLVQAYSVGVIFIRTGTQLSNGDVLISQDFGNNLRQYATDGSPVRSFSPNGDTRAFGETAKGGILFGGNFTTFKGIDSGRIVKELPDGTVDPNFVAGTGFNNTVEAIAVAPDGSIWVGGLFTSYNGVPTSRLVRLKGEAEVSSPDPLESFLADAGVPVDQRGLSDDWDGDSIPNIIELLYALDPAARDTVEIAVPLAAETGSDLNAATGTNDFDSAGEYFTFSILLPTDLQGYTLDLQATSDLSDFANSALTMRAVGTPTPVASGFVRVTYVIESPMTSTPAAFVRIVITE